MNIKIQKQIQNTKLDIEIEDRSDKEALAKALFFAAPDKCGLCEGQNVYWNANKSKDDKGQSFTYIKRVCANPNCQAASTMGEYQTGGFFWKKWEIYHQNNQPKNPTYNPQKIKDDEMKNPDRFNEETEIGGHIEEEILPF